MQRHLFLIFLIYTFSSITFAANTFKVLTFNAWLVELPIPKIIYEVSLQINERLKMIPPKIADTGADIVVLEEVWKDDRKEVLIQNFKSLGYPYAIYKNPPSEFNFRGLFGNGLLIVSKFPLDPNIDLLKFSVYTRKDEFFTYKGAIKTRVNLPHVGWIDLFNSHLGAFSTESKHKNENSPDHFNADELAIKLVQSYELANFIREKSTSEIVLVTTDLNTHYNIFLNGKFQNSFAPEYTLMTCTGNLNNMPCLGLLDTYREVHGFTTSPAWTYDTQSNEYARGGVFASEPQGVLDYIFINQNSKVTPVDSQIVFNEINGSQDLKRFNLQTLPPFLSDHYGVLTTFEIH